MPHTFTCLNCGKVATRNPRIKKQKYCSSRICQNARRNVTNKKRLKKNDQTQKLRQLRNKRWRDTYPAHKYQRQYREAHREYVDDNRQKQNLRNRNRQKNVSAMIVKTYALSPHPMPDGVYMGFEVKSKKIVKTYAYMPAMHRQQGVDAHFSQKPG